MKVDAKLFGKISFFRTTEKYKQIIWEALNIFISCKCSLTQKSSLLGYFGKKNCDILLYLSTVQYRQYSTDSRRSNTYGWLVLLLYPPLPIV